MSINEKFRFEYDIIDNCNLNCAGCSHYAPIGEDKYISAEKADEELCALANVIQDDCDIVHLMGGEPLLHPNIIEILEVTRKHFPKTNIQIVTNGVLLADMNPTFWKKCNELKITICVTLYPVKLKMDKINVFAKAFNVPVREFRYGKYFTHYVLDKDGKQDINNSYKKCSLKDCPQYHDGKLYPCTITGCVYKLNNHFNSNFVVEDDNYLEIDKHTTKEEIFNLLNNPISFCKYCMVDKWNDENSRYEWCVSKKEKKEWINEQ